MSNTQRDFIPTRGLCNRINLVYQHTTLTKEGLMELQPPAQTTPAPLFLGTTNPVPTTGRFGMATFDDGVLLQLLPAQ